MCIFLKAKKFNYALFYFEGRTFSCYPFTINIIFYDQYVVCMHMMF